MTDGLPMGDTVYLMPPGGDKLRMWTIYDHPLDFPNHYVARLWEVESGAPKATRALMAAVTIDSLREKLEQSGWTCIMRSADDDKTIVETWL